MGIVIPNPYNVIWIKPIKNSASGVCWYKTTLLHLISLFWSEPTNLSHAVAFNQATFTKAYVIMQERQKANQLCLMFRQFTYVHARYVCLCPQVVVLTFRVGWLIYGLTRIERHARKRFTLKDASFCNAWAEMIFFLSPITFN